MRKINILLVAVLCMVAGGTAYAAILQAEIELNTPDISSPAQALNGLSVKAIFTLSTSNAAMLKIELFNTSTGVPSGFSNADQLLTGISFDFGESLKIIGGTVVIGPGSVSYNFDKIGDEQLVAGDDVSGEWGYGNSYGSGMLLNFASVNQTGTTRMGTVNLDGPPNGTLGGPQGGISSSPPIVAIGGLGCVGDSVVIELTLDSALANLDFLYENGVMAEFGSDAAFLVVPEPATIMLLGIAGLVFRRKI